MFKDPMPAYVTYGLKVSKFALKAGLGETKGAATARRVTFNAKQISNVKVDISLVLLVKSKGHSSQQRRRAARLPTITSITLHLHETRA